jgi:hypothetical protein
MNIVSSRCHVVTSHGSLAIAFLRLLSWVRSYRIIVLLKTQEAMHPRMYHRHPFHGWRAEFVRCPQACLRVGSVGTKCN